MLILVGGIALVVFIVVAFANPYLGLLVCIVSEYMQPGKIFPALAPYRPFMVMVIVVGFVWVFRMLTEKKPFVVGIQTWIFLAFLFVGGLSIFGALNQGLAFDQFVVLLKIFVVYFLIINMVDSAQKLKGVVYSLVGVHVYMAFSGLRGYMMNPENRDAVVGTGFFLGDANELAMALNMILPITFFLIFAQKKVINKALLILSGILIVIVITLTFSRGGFIGLAVVLLYSILISRKKVLSFSIAGLLVILMLFAAPDRYWDRIHSISQYQNDSSAMIRLEAWKAGVRMAIDNPFLGVGFANFGYAHGMIYRVEDAYGEHWNWVASHSIYFGTLGELGFSGLLLLLSMMGSIFFANRRSRPLMAGPASDPFLIAASQGLEVGLVALMVCGIFLSILTSPFLWYNAALTVALWNLVRQSVASREPEWSSSALMGNHADLRV